MGRGRWWRVMLAAIVVWSWGAADAAAPAATSTVDLPPVSIAAPDAAACDVEGTVASPTDAPGETVVSFVLLPPHCVD